jgi:hypothetical protein
VYVDKLEKHAMLAREVKADRDISVEIILVFVSSLGAVHGQSLKALGRLFMCEEKQETKIGRKLSQAAIAGSLEICRGQGHPDDSDSRLACLLLNAKPLF